MRSYLTILAAAAIGFCWGGVPAAAQGPAGAGSEGVHAPHAPHLHNPIKWPFKGSKSASEQLAANSALDQRLTSKLQSQGLLPKNTDLKDACSSFKNLGQCIAAIHVSHNLGLNFDCVKWNLTAVKPDADTSSCARPAKGKAMSLGEAIRALRPDVDAKLEANNAEKEADKDLKEAKS